MTTESKEIAVLPVVSTEQYIEQQLQAFPEPEEKIAELKAKADELVIVNLHDSKGYKAVDELRKEAKRKRITVDKYRKELLEIPKQFTKKVNERANQLIALLEEVEVICETKQSPIDEERERIKREEEAKEAQRKAEEERKAAEERARLEMIAKREEALLRGGFLASLEEYILHAANGQKFTVKKSDVHAWTHEQWLAFAAEVKAFKAANTPPPEPVQQAAPAPVAQPVQAAPAVAPPVQQAPAPAPAGITLPKVGKPEAPAQAYAQAAMAGQVPAPAAHPAQAQAPAQAPAQAHSAVAFDPAYVAGFNAAKAVIVAHLHDPNVKLTREGWIDFIKSLPVQSI